MIEIRHLTKKYGDNEAVKDLNLTLEPGHVYGFLGPNGAGKTTTMNMITGYIGATAGEVLINGHDINKEPEEAKKCIGYLPEQPPVYADMKVLEYLKFVAELKGIPKQVQNADIKQVMQMTKLEPMQGRLIRNLSKGYRQRVGLAQALMGMPEFIILDEPTVGLDPKQIIEIRELIRTLREKHTIILSSHILQEISAVCDHVFIISRGVLVASDTMENLEGQMTGRQLEVIVKATEEQAAGLLSVRGVKSGKVTFIKEEKAEADEEQAPENVGAKNEEGQELAQGPTSAPEEAAGEPAEAAGDAAAVAGEASVNEPTEAAAEEAAPAPESAVGEPEEVAREAAAEETAESAREAAVTAGEAAVREPAEAVQEATVAATEAAAEETAEMAGFAVSVDVPENADVAAEREIGLLITPKPDLDLRETIFGYCVENSIVLLEMHTVTKSLEDIFLELTSVGEA